MTKRPTEQQARRLAEVIQQEWSKDSQHLLNTIATDIDAEFCGEKVCSFEVSEFVRMWRPNAHSRSDCWEALRTAIVLAERDMLPGPKLLEQWKQMLPNDNAHGQP